MSITYLLPCSCGRKIRVQPRHAGEQVVCGCGCSFVAPTMLEMTRLETAEPGSLPASRAESWGWRQRAAMIGVVIAGGSAALIAVLIARWPVSPIRGLDTQVIQSQIDTFTPARSLDFWRSQVEQGLDTAPPPIQRAYERTRNRFQVALVGLSIAAAFGVGLVLAGVAWPRPARG